MLIFRLKKEWFEKIKSGEKTHEYRVASAYWNKRILNIILSNTEDEEERELERGMIECCIKNKNCFSVPVTIPIAFSSGYPSKGDSSRIIYAKATRISLSSNGIFTDLKINRPVFDIEFGLIKEKI